MEIPAAQFEEMLRYPLTNQDFLKENLKTMYQDGNGVYHCLLVTGRDRADGLLVESDGSCYARYAAYVPQARALRYPVLAELEQKLTDAVDFIIQDGTSHTSEGNWILDFDELEEQTGLAVYDRPFLQELIGDLLCSRPEVADLSTEDGHFDVTYYLDFCQGYEKKEKPQQTLRKLIAQGIPADTYLVHPRDVGFIPAGRLEASDLESGMLEEWSDILDAEIIELGSGGYGQEFLLEGIPVNRLRAFDDFLSQYAPRMSALPTEIKM